LAGAIAAEIERATAQARAEVEGRLVQAQAEAVELATTGEALEIERDILVEQVAALTRERDTLSGKAAQQAADINAQAQRIEREQQAAESARIELATARLKIEAQAEKQSEQGAEIERLRAALETSQQAQRAAEQAAAVLGAKFEAMTDRAMKAEARAEQSEKEAQHARQAEQQARIAEARATMQKSGEEAADLRSGLAAVAGEIQTPATKTETARLPAKRKARTSAAEPNA